MRRFTNDEESEYANCKSEALAEVTALHQAEIDKLEATIAKADALTESLKDDLKKAKTKLKQAKKDKKNTTSVETEITTIKKEQADNRLNKKTIYEDIFYQLFSALGKTLVQVGSLRNSSNCSIQ